MSRDAEKNTDRESKPSVHLIDDGLSAQDSSVSSDALVASKPRKGIYLLPNLITSAALFAGFYGNLYPEYGEVNFVRWMLVAVPLVIVFIPIVWQYLCRFVPEVPLDDIDFGTAGTDAIKEELQALGRMSGAERSVALVFLTTALLWLFRSPLDIGTVTIPGWANLFDNPKYLHDATVAMAMGILLTLLPVNFGKGVQLGKRRQYFVLDWETVQKKVPWGILLLFGGGFALADGFAATGLDNWIGVHLAGLTALPIVLMILVVCLAITFLTELTSNTATTTMILPIIGAAAVAANYHPLLLMVPATMSASFAFMLPVATPPNAIVYGSGWVSINKMSRAGIWLNFVGAILVTATVLFLAQWALVDVQG